MRSFVIGLTMCLFAVPSFGQSLNIEIEGTGGGWGAGSPPASFEGAASQPGVWNIVSNLNQSYALANLDGSASGVTFQVTGAGGPTSSSNANSSGNFSKLLDDGLKVATVDDTLFLAFDNLEPGRYLIYTYVGLLPYGDCCETGVAIVPFIGMHSVGGYPIVQNTFYEDRTHARNLGIVNPLNTHMEVWIKTNPDAGGFPEGVVTGMQLLKLPERIYVRKTTPDGGNGHSWETAFNDLQDALALAREWNGAVDEIWVAEGTYYATDDTDQYVSFNLPTGIADLYGGFAGTETSLDDRDPAAHPTTLSGNIGGSFSFDNTNAILIMTDNYQGDDDALIDGFTIFGGSGGLNGEQGYGAGLTVLGGSLTVRQCRFIANSAETGGAVYATRGTVTFVDSEFLGNSASSNGGAFTSSQVPPNAAATARFINCKFHNNDADFWGGTADLSSGDTTFVNCVFTGSDSQWEGGAIHASGNDTTLALSNCTMAGNHSNFAGGAVAVGPGASASLVNTILWDNVGLSYAGQINAQIFRNQGTISANYCTIQNYFSLVLPGIANNGLNPQFVNANGGDGYGGLNDDLRLSAGSPMIDAGSNFGIGFDIGDLDGDGNVAEQTPLDLDWNPRRIDVLSVMDTGNGFGALADRGAFKVQQAPILLGDMDCNGAVELADVPAMNMALVNPTLYGSTHGCLLNGDFTGDGSVDGADLQGFVDRLLE